MKIKMAVTVALTVVSAVAVVLAFQSYGDITDKLNLETSSQKTMQVKEEMLLEDQEAVDTEEADDEEVITEEQQPEAEVEQEVTEEPVEVNPEAPVLTLKSDRVEIAAGDDLYLVSQVADITDDKDERRRLFHNIEIFGEYDENTPGEYELEFVVTDSDGNRSIPKTLKLIVK